MKIKYNNDNSSLPPFIRDFFKKKEFLFGGILGAAGLMAFGLLFLGAMGYGAYLAKVGQEAYEKPMLIKVSELDFSFLQDYTAGKQPKVDDLAVEIALNDLQEMQSLREQALEEGVISQAIKDHSFPATLTYQGKSHNVNLGLTGMMAMQMKDPSKWSFQVKAEGGDRIEGMKQFRLLLPSTGGYLTDWLGAEVLQDQGLHSLEKDFIRLRVNGKLAGIFYLEEQFDKELAHSSRFGEGLLFKIENDLDIYQENQLMEQAVAKDQILLVKRRWQDFKAGRLLPGAFFDLEKMGKLFAIADFMNHKEPLLRQNLSFRVNPQTGLAEPIARQFKALNNSNHATFASFLASPSQYNKWHTGITEDPIIRLVYDDLDFKRAYIREIAALCPVEYVDDLLMRNGNKLDFLLKKVYQDWPAYDLPTQSLYGNQRYIQSVLYPDMAEVIAHLNGQTGNYLNVYLQNQQDIPMEISHLGWRDSVFFYPAETTILGIEKEGRKEQSQVIDFEIPKDFLWADSLLQEMKVYYSILGLSSEKRSMMIFPWSYDQRLDFANNPVVRPANYMEFDFIKAQADKETVLIPSGVWTLSRDLVIPKNKRLQIEAGAQIDMINNAKIFSYSPIFSMGTKENPVLVKSSDKTAQGLIIIRANQRSTLQHTHFDQISCPKEDGWGLSGAVVFYESPVTITSTSFSGNLRGDDFLNIVRADFEMDSVLFKDINADAFDCDFCTGTITNSAFVNVGNDGIDVSGTKIEVTHVKMERIGDKGLSAGENSEMTAKWIEIRDSEIGATSKDRSRLYMSDIQMINTRIGIALFMKKTEFGPAYANAERVTIEGAEIPYLIEDNSQLVLDGNIFLANRANVKEILYGAEFGKSSK